jgi:hypothetical protein
MWLEPALGARTSTGVSSSSIGKKTQKKHCNVQVGELGIGFGQCFSSAVQFRQLKLGAARQLQLGAFRQL